MEKIEKQKETRICEKWIQIESCRKCLFEILCNYEKMKKALNSNDK